MSNAVKVIRIHHPQTFTTNVPIQPDVLLLVLDEKSEDPQSIRIHPLGTTGACTFSTVVYDPILPFLEPPC